MPQSTKRIAIVSSYNEECGAAFYSSRLLKHLQAAGFHVDVKRLPVSLLRISKPSAIRRKGDLEIKRIAEEIRDYDVVLIQFEPGLYGTVPEAAYRRVEWLLMTAKRAIVTVHGFHRGVSLPGTGRAAGLASQGRLLKAVNEAKRIARARSHGHRSLRFWRYVRRASHVDVMTFCRADEMLLRRFFDLPQSHQLSDHLFRPGRGRRDPQDHRSRRNPAPLRHGPGETVFRRVWVPVGVQRSPNGVQGARIPARRLGIGNCRRRAPQALESDRDIGRYLRQLLAFPLEAQRHSGTNSAVAHRLGNIPNSAR